jgi:hypothetical protein
LDDYVEIRFYSSAKIIGEAFSAKWKRGNLIGAKNPIYEGHDAAFVLKSSG